MAMMEVMVTTVERREESALDAARKQEAPRRIGILQYLSYYFRSLGMKKMKIATKKEFVRICVPPNLP